LVLVVIGCYICFNSKPVTMANAIKVVPVLKKEVASAFNRKANAAVAKKSTVKFSKQAAVSAKILAKAKI
jgi:hypothetical protein